MKYDLERERPRALMPEMEGQVDEREEALERALDRLCGAERAWLADVVPALVEHRRRTREARSLDDDDEASESFAFRVGLEAALTVAGRGAMPNALKVLGDFGERRDGHGVARWRDMVVAAGVALGEPIAVAPRFDDLAEGPDGLDGVEAGIAAHVMARSACVGVDYTDSAGWGLAAWSEDDPPSVVGENAALVVDALEGASVGLAALGLASTAAHVAEEARRHAGRFGKDRTPGVGRCLDDPIAWMRRARREWDHRVTSEGRDKEVLLAWRTGRR